MVSENDAITYKDFLRKEHGFIFKFVKKGDSFIHTFIEGELIKKFGHTPELVVGNTLFDFLPEQQAKQKHQFYQMAWDGNTVNYEGQINGVYYLATLIPIKIDSTVVEVIATAIDITKEKIRDKKLQQLEKLSVIGQLAAGIAHEIRNPLTSIKGFTQLVKERVHDKDLDMYLSMNLVELERINEIVNEFMLIAKPKEVLILKETNINTLLHNVIQFMEPQSNMKSIIIKPSFHSTIIADCDSDKLKQVLINVLKNAIEATNDSASDVHVELQETKEQEFLIKIIDKGCGILEERQKKLFEPFYSTKEKGIGLGLLVCKRIIDIHHGRIEIESQVGIGTTVKIYLPKKITTQAGDE